MSKDTIVVTGSPVKTFNFGNLGEINLGRNLMSMSPRGNGDPLSDYPMMEAMEDGTWTKALLACLLDPKEKQSHKIMMLRDCAYREALASVRPKVDYFNQTSGHPPKTWKSSASTKKLTNRAFAPLRALEHYRDGSGKPLSISLDSLNLTKSLATLTPVASALKNKAPGEYRIAADFSYNFQGRDNTIWLLLGRITLRTEGQLRIDSSNSWTYKGVVRAYNDVFDANPDASRGPLGEALTHILSGMEGKPFQIEIRGEVPVFLSGDTR